MQLRPIRIGPNGLGHAQWKQYRLVVIAVIVLCTLIGLRKMVSLVSSKSAFPGSASSESSCQIKVLDALERARKVNERYRAFIELTPRELLIKRADELDAIPLDKRKSLHCSLVAVKDNIETSTEKWGLKTTAGSAALLAVLPTNERVRSAPAVSLLENEGIVILGKATMDDFALQYHSFSTRVGQALNCHDQGRFPGGSSGGSALAVSLGLVDFALGTDTGGSIRIPSAFAGVVGLRPSLGAVSTKGVVPLSASRDTLGPIAKRVTVVRKVFEILAPKKQCEGPRDKRKVGIVRELFTDDSWAEMKLALDVLRSKLEAQEVSGLPDSLTRAKLLKQTKSASMYEFKSHLEMYLKRQRHVDTTLEELTEKTSTECRMTFQSSRACGLVVDSMEKKIKTSGIVPRSVTESWQNTKDDMSQFMKENGYSVLAFPAFTADPTRTRLNKKQEFCPNNRLAAITGTPSLVVFAGFSSSTKLPQGLELIGLDECDLFAVGDAFERAFDTDGSCSAARAG